MTRILPFPGRKRGDEFTTKKLAWIEAVTLDATIPAEAMRLAVLLALKFLNRNSGCAFPSQKTLGELLGIKERQVRYHLGALVKAGYILQSNRGRNKPNVYKIDNPTGRQTANRTEGDRQSDGIGTGNGIAGPGPAMGLPPNPMKEPNEEPSDGRPTAGEPADGRSTLKGSRDINATSKVEEEPPPDGAATPRTFFVGMVSEHPERGAYTVIAIYPSERRVKIRFTESGDEARATIRPDDAFAADGIDDTVPF